ncbi:hypothetical protein Tco_1333814 [Tanacetum coccineum]
MSCEHCSRRGDMHTTKSNVHTTKSYCNAYGTTPYMHFCGVHIILYGVHINSLVQSAKLHKLAYIQEGGEVSVMSTQVYIKKVIKDVGEDDDFMCGSWLSAAEFVNVDGGIVSWCFGDIKKFCKNGKLEKFVSIIKSCTPNALGNLTITLKDPSGIISISIHYQVLTDERFGKAIIS